MFVFLIVIAYYLSFCLERCNVLRKYVKSNEFSGHYKSRNAAEDC